jgi:tetratricopeptide (TPR) repeat protein
VIGQQKRLALVIGNANYNEATLDNPINDAILMKETFLKLGFEVVLFTDIETYSEFLNIIENYNNKRKDYSVGFIYYAGHAVQISGVNYMLATKEKYETESNIKYKGVNISIFTDEWENPYENELNVLILDACRNNPFEKKIYGATRTIGKEGLGLAEIDGSKQPTGSIVAFSTAAGKTASDGKEGSKNSLYCQSLSTNLQLEDVSIRNIFGKVSKEIFIETNQYPVVSDKMFDVDFYLKKSTYIDQIIEIDSLIDAKAYDLARIKTSVVLIKSMDNKNALLRMGRIEYLTKGKKYQGLELYRAAEIYPNDPEVYEYLSRYFFTIGEHEKAIEQINEAIKLDSIEPNLFYWKARFLVEIDQDDLAEISYTKTIELDSKNSKRFYDRALFYVRQKKDYNKALEDYNESIRLDPLNITYLYGRAKFFKDELLNNDKAILDFEKLLKIDSTNLNAFNGIGLIYKDQGKLDLAITQFTKGIELENTNKSGAAYCYRNRAEIYAKQNLLDKALADYNKAIELDSNNSQRYYDRALFFKNLKKDYSKALEDYNEAIRLAPSNLTFLYGRAILYNDHLFQKNKAIQDYEKMLKIDSTNINAINGIGLIYYGQGTSLWGATPGSLDLAIIQFTKCIELEKTNKVEVSDCFSNRAMIYVKQNLLDKALADYNKAIELDFNKSQQYYNRGLFFINHKKDYDKALEDFNEAISLAPSNLNFLYGRAILYKDHLLKNDKAIQDYEKMLSIDSTNINAINGIGLIYKYQGNLDLAITQFNKGIKFESINKSGAAYCYGNRADTYSDQGKLDEALQDYTKAIDLEIFKSNRNKIRGDFYRDKLNRPFDALIDYSIAISNASKNINYLWSRGKLYSEKLNNQKLAIQDFEQILKIKPNDINAMNWLTIFYDRNNDMENAVKGYMKIISLGDSIKKLEDKIEDYGWANINLAEIYQCENKVEEALSLYNEGINYMPEHVKAYYWRAWFFALYLSKYDEAISDFSTSIKLEPKNPHWLLNRSKIFQMKGDLKSAKNDISEAVKISKESAIYIAERGNFYSITGEYDKATKDFKESLKLDSANRRTYHFITEDLIRQGKIDYAIKNATASCKLFKNDTVSFEQLGRIYFAKNDVHKSLSTYSRAASIMEFNEGDRTIYPHDIQVFLSDVHLKIAEIYKKLNQSDLECEALSKAKDIVIFETRLDRQKMIIEIQEKLKNCQN